MMQIPFIYIQGGQEGWAFIARLLHDLGRWNWRQWKEEIQIQPRGGIRPAERLELENVLLIISIGNNDYGNIKVMRSNDYGNIKVMRSNDY